MAYVLSSVSGNLISAASAGYAPTNSGDVSAIASAYQVVSSTATQLYAGTAYVTSVNDAPVSAERAGNAANASMANSAYYDGTGRLISALPDSAAVSAIASSYVESGVSGKQDTLSFAYNTADQISSINGSALGGMDEAAVSGIASAYAESAVSSKLDSSASSSFYSIDNPSGFLTTAYTPTFGYNTADQISSIDGSALGGMDEAAVSGIASAYAESAVSSVSGNYYTTANESGFLTAQAQASWSESASASPSYIQDKPDLVDIVAGPGIHIDNPDGNTLRVSLLNSIETVLWDGPSVWVSASPTIELSESMSNFERIGIYAGGYGDTNQQDFKMIKLSAEDTGNGAPLNIQGVAGNGSYARFNVGLVFPSANGSALSFQRFNQFNLGTSVNTAVSPSTIQRVVGINRTASAQ